MAACDRCHKRKTRCDGRLPQCGTCVKSGVRCLYPEETNYRQAHRDQLKSMEQRLRNLERENQQLRTAKESSSQQPSGTDDTGAPNSNTVESQSGAQMHKPSSPLAYHQNIAPNAAAQAETPPERRDSQAKVGTPASLNRYLGTSAGIEFVDLVESVVDSPNSSGDLFARVSDAYCKPRNPASNTMPLPAIPDRATAMQLIAIYFGHWHLTFPLLYRPAFLQLADRVYKEPDFYQGHPHCAFVFDIVLALGSATSERFEWSYKDTESHYTRAMSHFNDILKLRDIRTLQALLLCCQYGIHASLRDTADEMWDLLGKAERICVEIGLHQLKSSPPKSKCDIHLTGPISLNLQAELQRRCFWCFYSLDRYYSSAIL
jgi:Fungal specific transcription factor domain/Fungal Zn(2)-Cys(6) binuclear cluster domain